MKKLNTLLVCAIIISITVSACVDSSWLKIVGRWQDIEYPQMEIEFTQSGRFREYWWGELVSYGKFEVSGNKLYLEYLSKCGDNGMDCFVMLEFSLTQDTLIISDKYGDFRHRRVD